MPKDSCFQVQVSAMKDIDRLTVDVVTCHGTGTKLGDQVEITAINKSFKVLLFLFVRPCLIFSQIFELSARSLPWAMERAQQASSASSSPSSSCRRNSSPRSFTFPCPSSFSRFNSKDVAMIL